MTVNLRKPVRTLPPTTPADDGWTDHLWHEHTIGNTTVSVVSGSNVDGRRDSPTVLVNTTIELRSVAEVDAFMGALSAARTALETLHPDR